MTAPTREEIEAYSKRLADSLRDDEDYGPSVRMSVFDYGFVSTLAGALRALAEERDALQRERDEIAKDWETSNSLRAQLKVAIAERDYSVQMLSLTRQSIAAYQAGKLEAERDALRKERDEARRDAEWKVSRLMEADNAIKQSMAETAAALSQVAALIASLEPIERAVEAIESVDPLCPDECAALRANFDYWTRNLGRDNSEEFNRDSVRFGDLKRLRDLRRAALAAPEGEKGE